MENIIEYPPREDDVFARDDVEARIYEQIAADCNIYLAAPRRGGKTTLLYHLQDQGDPDYVYKYLPLANISDFAQYFETLHDLRATAEGLQRPMLVLVNEFQQAVETIMRQEGLDVAARFLRHNKELREQEDFPMHFVLTGSRSLFYLARKLNVPDAVDDLSVVDIPPLTSEQARDLFRRLLYSESVAYTDAALEHVLNRMRCTTPFYIQLLAYELIDEYAINENLITESQTDKAFNTLTHAHNVQFELFFKRVGELFNDSQYACALRILYRLAREDNCPLDGLRALEAEFKVDNCNEIVEVLCHEGFLSAATSANGKEPSYRFTMPILRFWWRNTVQTGADEGYADRGNPPYLSSFAQGL